jgi:hypothetical protein
MFPHISPRSPSLVAIVQIDACDFACSSGENGGTKAGSAKKFQNIVPRMYLGDPLHQILSFTCAKPFQIAREVTLPWRFN